MTQQFNDKVNTRAYAKINIGLDIVGKRADGYHNIKTLMHNIGLYDELFCEKSDSTEVISDTSCLKNDESNIIYRCAEMIRREYKTRGSIKVSLKKNIPMQAGLGGGSTDGAAAIYAFCMLYDIPFDREKLSVLSAEIGADIPFFLYGGCCLCEGIGQIVKKEDKAYDMPCVVVKPPLCINTKSAYGYIDGFTRETDNDFNKIISALGYKSSDLKSYINNDFEKYVNTLDNTLNKGKSVFYNCEAIAAGLSGSGSAFYGLFSDKDTAEKAAFEIKKILPDTVVFETSLKGVSFEII